MRLAPLIRHRLPICCRPSGCKPSGGGAVDAQMIYSKQRWGPRMKTAVAAVLLAVASLVPPAVAHADCGDPGQDPCTGAVPTVDQVVGLLSELTGSDRPAASKGDVVTPALDPQQAKRLDFYLNANSAKGNLPMGFTATDIQPAPANF